jgi:hypothetical protein
MVHVRLQGSGMVKGGLQNVYFNLAQMKPKVLSQPE